MIKVQGGSFIIGDIFDQESEDALPAHKVRISDFYIGQTEITYALYDAYAKRTGASLPKDSGYGRGERAVVYITWEDASEYCRYFGYRLPSEAEWEFAARSGGLNQLYAGTSDPDSLQHYAITEESNINFSYLVASKKSNQLGLFDMSGNVFEYVGEFYQFYKWPEEWYDLEDHEVRIIRGGSFGENIKTTRTYWRVGTLKDMPANDVGFRCAVSAEKY